MTWIRAWTRHRCVPPLPLLHNWPVPALESHLPPLQYLQGKLDQANKAVEKLLKTKDKCQIATIFILVAVFIITAIIAFS